MTIFIKKGKSLSSAFFIHALVISFLQFFQYLYVKN